MSNHLNTPRYRRLLRALWMEEREGRRAGSDIDSVGLHVMQLTGHVEGDRRNGWALTERGRALALAVFGAWRKATEAERKAANQRRYRALKYGVLRSLRNGLCKVNNL